MHHLHAVGPLQAGAGGSSLNNRCVYLLVVLLAGACPRGAVTDPDGEVERESAPCTTVLEGDLRVISDDDKAALAGICIVTGDLHLGSRVLRDLSGLESLESVEGTLIIGGETDDIGTPILSALTSLQGLQGLQTVGGSLLVQFNGELEGLLGLGRLTSVGGELRISLFNRRLRSLAGLEALTTVGGPVSIRSNAAFTSLEGLNNLTTAGGLLVSTPAVVSLNGLSSLSSIEGDLTIQQTRELTSLAGLGELASVAGDITIGRASESGCTSPECGNRALTDLALGNLSSLGGGLRIDDNPALPTCQTEALAERLGVVCDCSENNDDTPCP